MQYLKNYKKLFSNYDVHSIRGGVSDKVTYLSDFQHLMKKSCLVMDNYRVEINDYNDDDQH